MSKHKPIQPGTRFGHLIVLGEGQPISRVSEGGDWRKDYTSIVMCDCGNIKTVVSSHLIERIRSCGCDYRFEKIRKHNGYVGYKPTRICSIYRNMSQRCSNPNHPHYKDYGGRGITVCNEWRDSFVSFRDWALSHGYKDNLTIDRIDNDGNYDPSNCRWVTIEEQQRNRRSNVKITAFGKTMTLAEWGRDTGIPCSTIKKRLERGVAPETALLRLVG